MKPIAPYRSCYAEFERFTIRLFYGDATSGFHQGDCDEDVTILVKVLYIKQQLAVIGDEMIREELKETGGWNTEELADIEENKKRIVWIAARMCLDSLADEIRDKVGDFK